MLKRWLKIYALTVLPFFMDAQRVNIDSLVQQANLAQNDTAKLVRLIAIARNYAELNHDSSYHYSEISLALAQQLHLKFNEGEAAREMGYALLNKRNYPGSLQTLLLARAIFENPKVEQNVLVGEFPGDDDIMY